MTVALSATRSTITNIYRKGILGLNKLVKLFQDEWLDDIRNNQLASVLKGLGPMNTFVELSKFDSAA